MKINKEMFCGNVYMTVEIRQIILTDGFHTGKRTYGRHYAGHRIAVRSKFVSKVTSYD